MDITVLIMAEDKTHTAAHTAMRHNKYGLVDIFPVGKLQKQLTKFYTVDVYDVPVKSLEEAKALILPPVYSALPLATPEVIHRCKFVIDSSLITAEELAELAANRHLNLTWVRASEMFKDITQ